MTKKAIIDIEVRDEKFKALYELMQAFEEKLEKIPDNLKSVSETLDTFSEEQQEAMAKTFDGISDKLGATMDVMTRFDKTSRSTFGNFKANLKDSGMVLGKIASLVKDIGGGLLKFAGFGMATAGAGIFALDRLGSSAVSGQRQARGFGMTQGEMSAFTTDMSRYLAPGIIQSIAAAQSNYAGRVFLGMATGSSSSQVQNKDPAQVAIRMALEAHDWWVNQPEDARTSQQAMAKGFIQSGMSLEDIKRAGNTPREELLRAQEQYNSDKRTFNIPDKSTDEWYAFTRAMKKAGKEIEVVLTNRLAALGPVLGKLTDSVVKDLDIFINKAFSKENVEGMAKGIKSFAEYLGSKEFATKIERFEKAIDVLVNGLIKIGGWFGLTEEGKSPGQKAAQARDMQDIADLFQDLKIDTKRTLSQTGVAMGLVSPEQKKLMSDSEIKLNLPKGLMENIYGIESSYGANPNASSKGALGPFQFMPDTAKAYGIKTPMDFRESEQAAAQMMRDELNYRHGNLRQALADYNYGAGNTDKVINKYGKDWESHLPKETKSYIDRVMERIANTQPQVAVKVTNTTAARVAISVNAAR